MIAQGANGLLGLFGSWMQGKQQRQLANDQYRYQKDLQHDAQDFNAWAMYANLQNEMKMADIMQAYNTALQQQGGQIQRDNGQFFAKLQDSLQRGIMSDTPALQVAGMRSAGLNPAALSGQPVNAPSISAQSAGLPSASASAPNPGAASSGIGSVGMAQAPDYGGKLLQGLSVAAQNQQLESQSKYQDTMAAIALMQNDKDLTLKDALAEVHRTQAAKNKAETETENATRQAKLDNLIAQTHWTDQQTEALVQTLPLTMSSMAMGICQMQENINLMVTQGKLNEAKAAEAYQHCSTLAAQSANLYENINLMRSQKIVNEKQATVLENSAANILEDTKNKGADYALKQFQNAVNKTIGAKRAGRLEVAQKSVHIAKETAQTAQTVVKTALPFF